MHKDVIDAQAGISQATRIAGHIFLSGQVALDPQGVLVGEGDPAAQSEQIFRNIERLLERCDATLRDVTHLTTYFTDAKHFPAYARIKRQFFPMDPPAGTGIIVAGLLDPRFLLEVEARAVIVE